MSYGYCPYCGAKGVQAARNPVGPTICENGHQYPHMLRQTTSSPILKITSKPLIIYVDMDGVIADFEANLDGRNPQSVKLLPGSFISLKPIPGAIDALHTLIMMGHNVNIATKIPTHNVLAATEKLQWINQYIPELISKTIITPNKGILIGDILIDDRPHKANCEEFKGTLIHYGSEQYASWNEILNYIKGL